MRNLILISLLLLYSFFAFSQTNAEWENLRSELSKQAMNITASINQFDYEFNNVLKNTWQTPIIATNNLLQPGKSEWEVVIKEVKYDNDLNGYRVKIQFNCVKGEISNANVAINVHFDNWNRENYVLMPACAYNGNRFESRRISYSPKLCDMRDIGPDKPIIISDIPRLNIRPGESAMSVRSGDLSAPVLGVYSPTQQTGKLIHFSPASIKGDNGVILQENRERTKAIFSVTAPVVRERKQYFIADNQVESKDKPANFQEGDSLEIELAFTLFEASKIQTIYDRLFDIRYNFLGKHEIKPLFSFSSCFEVQENKFNTQNFVKEHGYYSVGMRETYTQDWAIGWTGGMISTYPLLFAGSPTTQQNVIRNFDWLFPNGISPSGFFWDSGEKGTIWYGGDQRKFHTKNWHIIRRSSDAVFFILKQFNQMKQMNIQVKDSWATGTKRVCDAMIELWNNNGQMGQFVNSQTGKIEVGGSTSAAIAPAALLLAADFYKNENYKQKAIEIAEYMYQNYISKGITCGGPADALQNPDSESAYSMLESFMAVYENTGDTLWLNRAREMAHQFATWVMTYNYPFPKESLFGKLNMQTLGTVWANTQNKHASPGICTHSGIALLKLYRATGDVRYLNLFKEIASTIPQYLSHPLRLIPGMKEGWISERINTTDWLEGIGEIMYGSTWAETALMLTYIEVPGVYIVSDKNICVTFDHVNAEIISSTRKMVKVKITNPTQTTANVKLKIENSSKINKPLCGTFLNDAKIVKLMPNESRIIAVRAD